jgi:hypothetical protein
LLVIWGFLQAITYSILGVASYNWYFIPSVAALFLLVGVGAEKVGLWVASRGGRWIGMGLSVALVLAIAAPGVESKATSPEGQARRQDRIQVYRDLGIWLREHTPADSTVAAMEIGVMGFFSERRFLDFLGLTSIESAVALRRGICVGR